MATAFEDKRDSVSLTGRCESDDASLAVAITHLSAEGCMLEANDDWASAYDFAHLTIADAIEMNGKLNWAQGRRAEMRFFGQVHPAAIAKLLEEAQN